MGHLRKGGGGVFLGVVNATWKLILIPHYTSSFVHVDCLCYSVVQI